MRAMARLSWRASRQHYTAEVLDWRTAAVGIVVLSAVACGGTQTTAAPDFAGKVVTGVRTVTYAVRRLKRGTYLFHCDIHPNLMNGTRVIGGG